MKIDDNEMQFQALQEQFLITKSTNDLFALWPNIKFYCENQLKKLCKHHQIIDYDDILNECIIKCIETVKKEINVKKMSSKFYWICYFTLFNKEKQFNDQLLSYEKIIEEKKIG